MRHPSVPRRTGTDDDCYAVARPFLAYSEVHAALLHLDPSQATSAFHVRIGSCILPGCMEVGLDKH